MQLYVFRPGDTCKKCNERKAEVVLRFRDTYCRYVSMLPRVLAYNEHQKTDLTETYWTEFTPIVLSLQRMFLISCSSQVQSFSW